MGDAIREPVRVEGVFFKSWLYRSRKVNRIEGETSRQQRRYTPIVIAGTPTWVKTATSQESTWGLWGGVAFLVVLAIVALNAARLASKDRRARATRPRVDVTKFEKMGEEDLGTGG